MNKEEVEKVISEFRHFEGVIGTVFINRDIPFVISHLPPKFDSELMVMLCTKIVDASREVLSESNMKNLRLVIIQSDEGKVLCSSVNNSAFMALVTEKVHIGLVIYEIVKMMDKLKKLKD